MSKSIVLSNECYEIIRESIETRMVNLKSWVSNEENYLSPLRSGVIMHVEKLEQSLDEFRDYNLTD